MNRGQSRRNIFIEDKGRQTFLDLLEEFLRRTGKTILSNLLCEFAQWCYYTGYRAKDTLYFNNAADLGIGAPFLLPSVAAVVIGGTSIFGGSGGYAGTIFGALILTVLDSLLTILNASQATRQILYGLIVLGLAAIYARTSSST